MIIYNNVIPFKKFLAINLFGFIFVRKGKVFTSINLNHEKIHTAQMRELLYIGFYLWYIIEWIILIFKYQGAQEAYENIRFEKEAYANEKDTNYLKNRSYYSFLSY